MAIAMTSRGSINSASDATSYASGSFTPSASVLLVAVYNVSRTTPDPPTTPTVSGHGTWTTVHDLYWNTDGTGPTHMWIFALNTGGAPGASAVTFDHAGVTHIGAEASIFELSGTDVAGGVNQCFVQFVDSSTDTDGGASSLTLTLATVSDSGNRPFMATASFGGGDHVTGASWTEIHDLSHATPSVVLHTQWRSDTFDTTAFSDYTGLIRRGGFASEIKISGGVGGGAGIVDPMGTTGFFGG